MTGSPELRRYRAPVWDEPILHELGRKGERGISVPRVEEEIEARFGAIDSILPGKVLRATISASAR
jgi:glycine dehydrogenase subunit 2